MEKDKLIIKSEGIPASGWRPITVSVEVYSQIKAIAEETGLPISKLACMILEFGLERVVIEKWCREE